ncbi:DUF885 domain-containing protein [Rheinheimera texasensis]|uniref:DUF885 domain-containing protein n=1 Tax=Rheinheimera texasensis TaxID=306205 RepID=UPI0004E1A52E|nr:DUF885 domain-containing protein [Rheinheimera texasensis]
MKQKLLVSLCCAALMACAQQPASTPADFDRFANDWWQRVEQVQTNTKSGLPDMSPAALEKAQQQRLALLAELNKTDASGLSEQQKINLAILQYRVQNDIDEYRFGAHYMPLTAESGFHSDVLFMLNMSSVKTEKDLQTYLEKLAALPLYMQQQMDWMRQGLAKGYTQPKAVLAGYEDSIKSFISTAPQQSPFYRPLLKQPAGIDPARWQALQQQASALISQQITPVYQQYLDFFTTQYVPGARDNIAAVALPDGAVYYQNRLEHYTTLKMTPQQVHQIGLQEVARIRAEMQQVIQQTGFKGSFAEFVQFLRTDPQFYVTKPEQLLKEAAYLSKKIDAQLPKLFKTLPRTPYGVEPVPAEIAPKYTTGRYAGGRAAGEPGFYWVNTYALDRRPLYELEALTLHEAVPGHHLQVALANEQESLPVYRRSFYTSAFGEGWGLYSEYLGLEVGFYTDPYSNFGRLTYEMWRACRLVVDTGMHTMGWSRQQAIDFLAQNTALSMHNVTTEVDRYISWPAQALSYKLGELTIKRLRQKAEKALGDKFNVREFHDAVLSNGSVPLSVLEQQIDLYIARVQRG